jgi:hypothetical protein
MHLLYQRRQAEEDRSHFSAKITILESLISRMNQGERINRGEVDRLRKLAGLDTPEHIFMDTRTKIRWRDVFLGCKEQPVTSPSNWDQKDWEKGASHTHITPQSPS